MGGKLDFTLPFMATGSPPPVVMTINFHILKYDRCIKSQVVFARLLFSFANRYGFHRVSAQFYRSMLVNVV